jgi:hypothetical protein
MLINDDLKIIFIHIPKSGGTSVRRLLENIPGTRRISGLYTHCSALDIRDYIGEAVFESYFRFSLVRHPYDRLTSFYNFALSRALERIEARKHGRSVKNGISEKTDIDTVREMTSVSPANWITEVEFNSHIFGQDVKRKPQVDWISDADGRSLVTTVYKIEEPNAFVNDFATRFAITNVELPHLNQSNRLFAQRDNELIQQFIYKYHREDLQRFGYGEST